MKKTFVLDEIDCANCAAKFERAVNGIDGVVTASVNFFAQKLILEAEDGRFDEILSAAQKIISKIEPDCKIVR